MRLSPALLTGSGRPVLQPGEVECSLLDKVDLEFQPLGGLPGQQADAYKDGYAILTTRRIIWVDAAAAGKPGRTLGLPLAAVCGCNKRVAYGIRGSKVRLVLDVYTDRDKQPVPPSAMHFGVDQLALRCRGSPPEAFKEALEKQLPQALAADTADALSAAGGGGAPAGGASRGSAAGSAGFGGASAQADTYSPLKAGLQQQARAPLVAGGASAGSGGAGGQGPGGWQEAAPDTELLRTMVEMGFPRNRSARALMATRNEGLQEAMDYMLAFGDQPGMDDPLDQPPTASAGPPPAAQPPAGGFGQPPVWAPAPQAPAPYGASAQYPGVYPAIGPGAAPAAPYGLPPTGPPQYTLPPSQQQQPSYGSGAAPGWGSDAPAYGYPQQPQQPGYMDQIQAAMVRQNNPMHSMHHPYNSAPDLQAAAAGGGGPGPGGSVGSGGGPGSAHHRPASEHGSSAIGVAGIVKREQAKTTESGRAVEQAFQDLSALMSSAATMVALAEKFRGVLQQQGSAGSGAGNALVPGEEDPLLIDSDTQQQLIALGISSPVTRETAGARYHIELSRQLADFLAQGLLARCGGLMPLPDAYCVFNRARGTELVSPDDLLQAAKMFVQAGVPQLRLRPLSSGVLVIQGPQHSEEAVCARIAELAAAPAAAPGQPPALGPGLAASDVARALGGVAVTIAAEHLLTAEARGVVVRDDGPEGLRFYRNFFKALEPGRMASYCGVGRG